MLSNLPVPLFLIESRDLCHPKDVRLTVRDFEFMIPSPAFDLALWNSSWSSVVQRALFSLMNIMTGLEGKM